jgi:hypothetical protein
LLRFKDARHLLQPTSAKQITPPGISDHPLECWNSRKHIERGISLSHCTIEKSKRVILLTELPIQLTYVPCIRASRLELAQNVSSFVEASDLH